MDVNVARFFSRIFRAQVKVNLRLKPSEKTKGSSCLGRKLGRPLGSLIIFPCWVYRDHFILTFFKGV